ncbi:hypothetical protein LLH23_22525 [bacterium]|nr:hypothetical protein [bacterium]
MKRLGLVCAAALVGLVELALLLARLIVPEIQRRVLAPSAWLVLPLLGLVLLGYALMQMWRRPGPTRQVGAYLLVAVIGLTLLAGGLTVTHEWGFGYLPALVLNPASNSYYQTAREAGSLSDLLRDYDAKMTGFSSHAQTQGAGPVVCFGLLSRLLDALPTTQPVAETLLALRPGVTGDFLAKQYSRFWSYDISAQQVASALGCGWTMVLLAALALIPLYALGYGLGGGKLAVAAVGAYAVLPSLTLYSGAMDQAYPLVVAGTMLGFVRGYRACAAGRQRAAVGWALLAGLLLALGLFLSLGMGVVGAGFVIIIGLVVLLQRDASERVPLLRRLGPVLLAGLAPVLVVFAGLKLVAGYDMLSVMRVSDAYRMYGYNHLWGRPYMPFLWRNLIEAAAFVGPLLAAGAWGTWLAWRDRASHALLAAVIIALPVMLIVLDVSGKIRGETSRMWLLLAPWFALTCGVAGTEEGAGSRVAWVALMAAAYTVIVRHCVHVWGF